MRHLAAEDLTPLIDTVAELLLEFCVECHYRRAQSFELLVGLELERP
jgi:hypothetical protein